MRGRKLNDDRLNLLVRYDLLHYVKDCAMRPLGAAASSTRAHDATCKYRPGRK
jgi:hypothetical protein